VDECKPLPSISGSYEPRARGVTSTARRRRRRGLAAAAVRRRTPAPVANVPLVGACYQGLKVVQFSAQLEPCLTQKNTLHTLNTSSHRLNTGCTTPDVHPLSHTKRSVELKS